MAKGFIFKGKSERYSLFKIYAISLYAFTVLFPYRYIIFLFCLTNSQIVLVENCN